MHRDERQSATILKFPGRNHRRPPFGSRTNASIGTLPSVASRSRAAKPSDGFLRPAMMLMTCHVEQPAASATASTDVPFLLIQRINGCDVSMDRIIPTGNAGSQAAKFLGGMSSEDNGLVQFDMADDDDPKLYLGGWLKYFSVGPTEAARLAGCSQAYITNLSAGRKETPNALYLYKLSEALGITVNDFYRPAPKSEHLAEIAELSSRAQATLLKRAQEKARAKRDGRPLSK